MITRFEALMAARPEQPKWLGGRNIVFFEIFLRQKGEIWRSENETLSEARYPTMQSWSCAMSLALYPSATDRTRVLIALFGTTPATS